MQSTSVTQPCSCRSSGVISWHQSVCSCNVDPSSAATQTYRITVAEFRCTFCTHFDTSCITTIIKLPPLEHNHRSSKQCWSIYPTNQMLWNIYGLHIKWNRGYRWSEYVIPVMIMASSLCSVIHYTILWVQVDYMSTWVLSLHHHSFLWASAEGGKFN